MRLLKGVLLSFAGPVAAAVLGGIASAVAPEFYASLDKPAWAPPAWLFGPAWTVLYFAMGVAAFLVWQRRDVRPVRLAQAVFAAQLVANALWSWLFFRYRLGAASVADIVLLVLLIVLTIALFWRIRVAAALLLVPYLAWVLYATALTISLVQRNPSTL